MVSYYVLFEPVTKRFAASGHTASTTCSINYAKHFTSIWSAENWRNKFESLGSFIVKRIERY